MDEIYLKDFLCDITEKDYCNYKLHFAKESENGAPLDAYLNGMDEWKYWNRWSNGTRDFNRKFIFYLIQFYPENDTWLFGGIWEVDSLNQEELKKVESQGWGFIYNIELTDMYKNLIGRLKVKYTHNIRNGRNKMEEFYPHLILKEIMPEPFHGTAFPGYKNLHLSFRQMSLIMERDRPEWRTALQLPGIYVLTDTCTGKRYVGQAGGAGGIWQRWKDYVVSGHGGNKNLEKLSKEYIAKNFTFTLLEIVPSGLNDELFQRESYWKNVLMTRNSSFGYNEN